MLILIVVLLINIKENIFLLVCIDEWLVEVIVNSYRKRNVFKILLKYICR